MSADKAQSTTDEPIWTGGRNGPLQGLRVVDFGQYVAGPLAAMLLADQGADVIRVDPPSGPRWASPANAVLLRGRRSITADLTTSEERHRIRALLGTADVVVENFRPGVTARLGIGPKESLQRTPGLVYCSLPGFGADDPRAAIPAWEGVVMAAAGAYAVPVPRAEPEVRFSPLPLGSVFAAMEGVTAIVGALIARRRDGLGQAIEVPLFDSLFEAAGAQTLALEKRPADRAARPYGDFGFGWYRCSDGRYINLISAWYRHAEWFIRAAGRQDWVDEGLVDYERLMSDPDAAPELRRRLVSLFTERPAHEWERLGRAHGCSLVMVRSMHEWMHEPHALESGTLADTVDPLLGPIRVTGSAVRVSTAPDAPAAPRHTVGADNESLIPLIDRLARASARGETVPRIPSSDGDVHRSDHSAPLKGIRVLEFTRVVAAPTATKLLAQMGADVIKVDSDRSSGQAITPEPILHEFVNRGKRSICLDLRHESSHEPLQDLFATADVIVQNFTLGVAERLGIDERSARAHRPDIVYGYLNAFGRSGPWSDARGYAELANTATGITVRSNGDRLIESGTHSMTLDLPRWTFTDYGAGVLGAFAVLLGLYQRLVSGKGSFVETSLIRATSLEQIVYQIDYAGRDVPEPSAGSRGWSTLHRMYDTTDGAVFIGAAPEQAELLTGAVGADDPRGVEAAISNLSSDEVCNRLTRSGIGAHRIESMSDLLISNGIADRRGLLIHEDVESFGHARMLGPVARYSRTPLTAGHFPAPFGADGAALLSEAHDSRFK